MARQIVEELGVNIYPWFTSTSVVYADNERVTGVRLSEVGLDRLGCMKESFESGMEFHIKVTLEGVYGSVVKELIQNFDLH